MDVGEGVNKSEEDQTLIDKYLTSSLNEDETILFQSKLNNKSFVKLLNETKEIKKTVTTGDMLSKLEMLKDLEDSLGKNSSSSDS